MVVWFRGLVLVALIFMIASFNTLILVLLTIEFVEGLYLFVLG